MRCKVATFDIFFPWIIIMYFTFNHSHMLMLFAEYMPLIILIIIIIIVFLLSLLLLLLTVLIKLVESILEEDTTLGIAYLLALHEVSKRPHGVNQSVI